MCGLNSQQSHKLSSHRVEKLHLRNRAEGAVPVQRRGYAPRSEHTGTRSCMSPIGTLLPHHAPAMMP